MSIRCNVSYIHTHTDDCMKKIRQHIWQLVGARQFIIFRCRSSSVCVCFGVCVVLVLIFCCVCWGFGWPITGPEPTHTITTTTTTMTTPTPANSLPLNYDCYHHSRIATTSSIIRQNLAWMLY